jgi:hypothetical protein
VGGSCSTHGRGDTHTKFWSKRHHLEEDNVKIDLNEIRGRVCTRLI